MTPRALRGLLAAVPSCRGSPRAGRARCVFSWRWFPSLEQLVREQRGADGRAGLGGGRASPPSPRARLEMWGEEELSGDPCSQP